MSDDIKRVFRLASGQANVEREVDEELAFHIEMRTKKLIERGVAPEQARAEALRQFGDMDTVRDSMVRTDQERERTMRRTTVVDEMRQDLMQGMRQLRHHAGFALTIILMLALGIGANTTIFTLVDAVLLRNLPVRDPQALVVVGDPTWTSAFSYNDAPSANLLDYKTYQALRRDGKYVSGLFASGRSDRLEIRVGNGGVDADRPRARFVSGNYFSVLGVRASLGRTFDASADDAIGGAPVITLSHTYWVRRFDSDSSIVGKEIVVNGTTFTVSGIGPLGFTGEIVGQPTDIWVPITMRDVLVPNERVLDQTEAHWILAVGRLRPGVSLPVAQAGLAAVVRRTLADNFGAAQQERIRTMTVPVASAARGLSRVRSTYGTPLLTLMTGVGLLLLIVCANVANLLLARSVARTREMTVRVAIGAGRGRLVRQLLVESSVLATLGALGGLALAWYGSKGLLLLAGNGNEALPLDIRLDLRVLAFTAGAAVLAIALFGLVPALSASRVDLASAMRAHARSVSGGVASRFSMGRLLIAGQVALSLVLLVGAALLVRSLHNLDTVETGLDRDHLLVVSVDKTTRGLAGARTANYVREVETRLGRLPGVIGVSWAMNGIFSGMESASTLSVPGFTPRTDEDSVANFERVSAGYVKAIGGRVVAGREFTSEDIDGKAQVVLINQTMARFYFGEKSPLDQFLRFDDSTAARVVGVIADVKDHALDGPPVRRYYSPYRADSINEPEALNFQVRTSGDPAALRERIRTELRAIDPLMPIDQVEPLSFLMRQSVREERLLARLSTGFGILALVLAAFGLYGVLTYAVTRRTGEIGLRVALGAQRSAVVGMVMRDALFLVGIGVIVGAPLSVAGGHLLASQLHGIGAIDPFSIGVALTALALSAATAALLPALRASRVAPLTALREE